MPLPTSGSLSLDQIHVEAGGTSNTTCSLNDPDIRQLINKTADTSNGIVEYRGASRDVTVTFELIGGGGAGGYGMSDGCLLYTSPSPRDATLSRMPSSA